MSFSPHSHRPLNGDQISDTIIKYEPTAIKNIKQKAKDIGGHGGMDFVMRYRIIECLRKGEPLDQNVYEGCFWSAVTPLSADSINSGG